MVFVIEYTDGEIVFYSSDLSLTREKCWLL
jgi:hypothetical protein